MGKSDYRTRITKTARTRFIMREFKQRGIGFWFILGIFIFLVLKLIPGIDLKIEILISLLPAVLKLWIAYVHDAFFVIPVEIYNKQTRRIKSLKPEQLQTTLRCYMEAIEDPKGTSFDAILLNVENYNRINKVVELEIELLTLTYTRIHEGTGEAKSHPFAPLLKLRNMNGETLLSLRPEGEDTLFVARLSESEPPRLVFGVEEFVNWLFEKEAAYQLHFRLIGKLEGEAFFRRFQSIQKTIYAHPSKSRLNTGGRAKDYYDDLPEELIKVIDVAEEGYSYYYD